MPIDVTERFVRVRVENPKQFVKFRFKILSKAKGIRAIIGFLPKGGSRIQSILFDKSKGWTVAKAKAWIKEHGYTISETLEFQESVVKWYLKKKGLSRD